MNAAPHSHTLRPTTLPACGANEDFPSAEKVSCHKQDDPFSTTTDAAAPPPEFCLFHRRSHCLRLPLSRLDHPSELDGTRCSIGS